MPDEEPNTGRSTRRRPPLLLERDRELARIDGLLVAAGQGRGGTLLIEGEAGIGKTSLLRTASALARERGFVVFSARGSELERAFPYGVARQLLEAELVSAPATRRARLLAGAAALAQPLLRPAGAADAAPAEAADDLSRQHGLYWLTANLSDEDPLVLLVDDAHLADLTSLRWLVFLARRLEGLRVATVLALRPREAGDGQELIDALLREPTVEAFVPHALGEASVSALVSDRFGADGDAMFVRACRDVSGGNPFLVHELLGALAGEDLAPVAATADRVRRIAPEAVARRVLVDLSRLGAEATALAQAIAVLGPGSQLRHAAELAGVSAGEAGATADRLASTRILVPERPLDFVHPLLHAAVYAELPAGRRSALHGHAARVLADDGGAPDAIAGHLLETDAAADPWVVDALRAAAQDALARGASTAAATYLQRALQEGTDEAERRELLWQLGHAKVRGGPGQGSQYLREALELTTDRERHAQLASDLAFDLLLSGGYREALDVLRHELALQADAPAATRLRIQVELAGVLAWSLDIAADLDGLLEELAPELRPDTPAGRALLAVQAHRRVLRCEEAAAGAAMAERALAGGLLEDGSHFTTQSTVAVHTLVCADAFAQAERWCDEGLRRSLAAGYLTGSAMNRNMLSWLAYRAGDLAHAQALAEEARRVEPGIGRRGTLAALVDALVARGDAAAAWELLGEEEAREVLPDQFDSGILLESRGRLRAFGGDHEGAVADLLQAGDRLARWGVAGPGVSSWRARAAESLVATGRGEKAAALAEEELALARRFGAPRAIGVALRAVALTRSGDQRLEALQEAVDVLARSGARLEHARALGDLGAALRRANHRTAAREPLRGAIDLAVRCGARPLAERCTDELRATGARPRRLVLTGVDALTASERRVCELAAGGMSNPEIAQALFVARATVESHLHAAYRKLDIPSRAGLAEALRAKDP